MAFSLSLRPIVILFFTAFMVVNSANASERSILSDSTPAIAFNAPSDPEDVFYDSDLGYTFWIDSGLEAVLVGDIASSAQVFIALSASASQFCV